MKSSPTTAPPIDRNARASGVGTPAQVAETLAELKAQRVARKHAGALVIGADQMLSCNDVWFDKPADRDHAAAQLRALAGKTHTLWTSVCVVRGDARLWHHNAAARLTMRSLSDDFIAAYLDAAAVAHWRRVLAALRPGSHRRTSVEMGLAGVVSTQLWHHTYVDGSLADLPSLVAPAALAAV